MRKHRGQTSLPPPESTSNFDPIGRRPEFRCADEKIFFAEAANSPCFCNSSSTGKSLLEKIRSCKTTKELVLWRHLRRSPSGERRKLADRKQTLQWRTQVSLLSTRRERCEEASRSHWAWQGVGVLCAATFRTLVDSPLHSPNSKMGRIHDTVL